MLRSFVFLAGALSATATLDTEACVANWDGFVDGAVNSFVDIWAASKRCSPEYAAANTALKGVTCVHDVAASIQSCIGVIDEIVGMLKTCFPTHMVEGHTAKCVSAAGNFVANTAGIVSASAGIANDCSPNPSPPILAATTALGDCIALSSGSAHYLLEAIVKVQKLSKCTGGQCKQTIAGLVNVLAHFGSDFAGAFNHCALVNGGTGNHNAQCASDIFGVLGGLTGLAHHGIAMARACAAPKESSKYDATGIGNGLTTSGNPLVFVFAAALPITAIVSFFVGSRLAKVRGARNTAVMVAE